MVRRRKYSPRSSFFYKYRDGIPHSCMFIEVSRSLDESFLGIFPNHSHPSPETRDRPSNTMLPRRLYPLLLSAWVTGAYALPMADTAIVSKPSYNVRDSSIDSMTKRSGLEDKAIDTGEEPASFGVKDPFNLAGRGTAPRENRDDVEDDKQFAAMDDSQTSTNNFKREESQF
ncbi:hypothetical protein F4778DRAFT_594292 [Xylariomycetidae sp. FL2044]|nr:hypothetical protein F4778DRAFT_594292 [Xylariomycetidae sp. FL2044]